MSKAKPLDARTLRYVARRMRKGQRECFASEARFRRSRGERDAETAEFFRGFGCCYMHTADELLQQARAVARKRKAP